MPKRRVTSRQVAQKAGVSQTTVSFVLNQVESANISEETQMRVLKAARELGYVPDAAARSLARGKSSNIALVLARPHEQVFIDEYLPTIITGLSEVARQEGYRILLEVVEDSGREDAYDNLVRGREAAGMIVNLNNLMPQDIDKIVTLIPEGFPVVTLDDVAPSIYSVMVDKLGGTQRMIEYLIELGHRRIACISYAPAYSNAHAQRRMEVYCKTLEAAGIGYDEGLVRYGNYDPDTGYVAMKSLLELKPLPTAIYGMNDVMAFGAIRAIQEAGLRVPEDISVVGFDDIRLAAYTNPPLTTMREPDREHGRRAGKMLIELIQGKTPATRHLVLNTELIIRQSSAGPRDW